MSFALAFLMLFMFATTPVAAQLLGNEVPLLQDEHYQLFPDDIVILDPADMFFDPARQLAATNNWGNHNGNAGSLTQTMGAPIGMIGFEGDYELSDGMVEIAVQFNTPPHAALRLLSNAGQHGRTGRSLVNYEAIAKAAHDTFFAQFATLPMPFFADSPEVMSRHYTLFNGVFMRVHSSMVESIAALPGVFSVTPNYAIFSLEDSNADDDFIGIIEASNGQTHSDLFMRGPMEEMGIDAIHSSGIHGDGIRVAVIDSGIDRNHPQFANFLRPAVTRTFDEYGRTLTRTPYYVDGVRPYVIPGWCFVRNHPIPDEFDLQDSDNRLLWTSHGTHVAGTVVAIAPNIEMYHYRVLGAQGGYIEWLISAMEMAYDDNMDVINLSLGSRVNNPWSVLAQAQNIASLAGIVVVTSAGNDFLFFPGSVGVPAVAPLGIAVGNSRRGGIANHTMGGQIATFTDDDGEEHEIFMRLRGVGFFLDVDEFNALSPLSFLYLGAPYEFPEYAHPDFADAVEAFRYQHFGATGDAEGYIVIFKRGHSDFINMRDLAMALNAAAFILVDDRVHTLNNSICNLTILFDGIRTPNHVPVLTTRQVHYDLIINNPNGTFTFLPINYLPQPDCMMDSSSAGPVAMTHHIKPDIVAPGFRVFSTVPSITVNGPLGGHIYHNAYHQMSGTSMSAPSVAAVAALMLQQFPDAAPYEIKARMMNAARPMAPPCGFKQDILGQDWFSVFHIGAGHIMPQRALDSTAFAVVRHDVPFLIENEGENGESPTLINGFIEETMSSLSFGAIMSGSYRDLTVEIRNAGTQQWNYAVHWNTNHDGVYLQVIEHETIGDVQRLTLRMSINSEEPWHEGNVVFSNGVKSLTMPFAALAPADISYCTDHFGIWRPIVSNFVIDELGQFDPRHWRSEGFADSPVRQITGSNVIQASLRINDPSLPPNVAGNPRDFDIIYVRYDDSGIVEGPIYGGSFRMNSNQSAVLGGHIAGRFEGSITGDPNDPLEYIALTPGAWNVYFYLQDPHLELTIDMGKIIVVGEDDQPEIIFDNDGRFEFDEGDTAITITGRFDSWGVDLAIANDIWTDRTYLPIGLGFFRDSHPLDYRTSFIADGCIHWHQPGLPSPWTIRQRINPDGTFEIQYPITQAMRNVRETTHDFQAVEGLDDFSFALFFVAVGAQVSPMATATFVNMAADPSDLESIIVRGTPAERHATAANTWNVVLPFGTDITSIVPTDFDVTTMHPDSIYNVMPMAPGVFWISVTPLGGTPVLHTINLSVALDVGEVFIVFDLETLEEAMDRVLEFDVIRFAPNTHIVVGQITQSMFEIPAGANVIIEGAGGSFRVEGTAATTTSMFRVMPGAVVEFRDMTMGGVMGAIAPSRRSMITAVGTNEANPEPAQLTLRNINFDLVNNAVIAQQGSIVNIYDTILTDLGTSGMFMSGEGTSVTLNNVEIDLRDPVTGARRNVNGMNVGGIGATLTLNDVEIHGTSGHAINANGQGISVIFNSGRLHNNNQGLNTNAVSNAAYPVIFHMNGGILENNNHGIQLAGNGNIFNLNSGYVRDNTVHGIIFGGNPPLPGTPSYARGGNELIINGGQITGNAQQGIHLTAGNLTIESSLPNRVVMNDGVIANNGGFGVNILPSAGNIPFTFNDGTIANNALQIGGTLNINANLTEPVTVVSGMVGAGEAATLRAGTVNINAGGIIDLSSAIYGNAVTMTGNHTTLNILGGSIVGAPDHGVLATGGNVSVNMTSGAISGSRNLGDVYGGAIAMTGQNPIFNMTGGTISNNTATNGGALYILCFDNVIIEPAAIFTNNTATNGRFVDNELALEFASTIRPGNVSFGTHPFNNLDIFVEPFSLWAISLNPANNKDFGRVEYGNPAPAAHQVTVANAGNEPTGPLGVELSGADAGSFTLNTGNLPDLDVNAPNNTATFTVVPNDGLAVGIYNATVTVSGGNNILAQFNVTFEVFANAPEITTLSQLPSGIINTAYSQTLHATGTGNITWALIAGELPDGLILSADGVIWGAPTEYAEIQIYTFTVEAFSLHGTDTRAFTLEILEFIEPVQIITTSLPGGVVNENYSAQLNAQGTAPITWSIAQGVLPEGLNLDNVTGTISGVPTATSQTQTFTITAHGPTSDYYREFTIVISLPHPVSVTVQGEAATIMQGEQMQFIATVLPLEASQQVEWRVSEIAGVSISAGGLLAVNESVPANTIITVTAIAAGTEVSGHANVTVIAMPPQYFALTVQNNPAGAVIGQTPSAQHQAGATVVLTAGTRANYNFTGWTFTPSVTFAAGNDAGQSTTRFIMHNTDVTAAANWTPIPSQPPADTPPPTSQHPGFRPTPPRPEVTQPSETPPTPEEPQLPEEETPPAPPIIPQPPAPPTPPAPGIIFEDIDANDWFYNYVIASAEAGIFQGTAEGIFSPYTSMTRAMFVQALANFVGADLIALNTTTPTFDDVSPNAWYFAAVQWAYKQGFVLGVGENNFDPNAPVTREQIAVMLYRYINESNIELSLNETITFTDQDQISYWAYDAVAFINAAGIIEGRPDGNFDPLAMATRAEVATVFVRLISLME